MAKEQYLFKNSINPQAIKELGKKIKQNYTNFEERSYNRYIVGKLAPLSLTERINLVTDGLYVYLPKDFKRAIKILLASLPSKLPNHSRGIEGYDSSVLNGLNGFIMVSLTNYVSRYGLDNFNISMSAFHNMTKCFSAEASIRHFILKYPDRTLKLFSKWSTDEDMHVRRLVSESTRPRLPWAMQLPDFIKDPNPILPLLETLKNDPELYVRRSVANNLNDIAKDNPHTVTTLFKKWNDNKSLEMEWLIKHGLRTLIKQGNPQALQILGFSAKPNVEIKSFRLSKKSIKLGESLEINLHLISSVKKEQPLIIDYRINHLKANGKLMPKVFKWTKKIISKESPLIISKKHAIKEISTRKYYSGSHEIEIQINGKIVGMQKFTLEC